MLSAWQAGADLAIDLEAALQLLRVVFAERPGERPVDVAAGAASG